MIDTIVSLRWAIVEKTHYGYDERSKSDTEHTYREEPVLQYRTDGSSKWITVPTVVIKDTEFNNPE